jgi:radical SAM protein with 4Fe4S-binding SPASM domain
VADEIVTTRPLPEFALWDVMRARRALIGVTAELTARCNLDCRHCYIRVPAGDRAARSRELDAAQWERVAGEAVALGAVWYTVTGGEPLLREDFPEIYLSLKRKGLLVSVFTNATLVTDDHVALFRSYPPRDVEITAYGATRETYERVTRVPGSFAAFRRGVDRLVDGGIKVRFKAMALRSNVGEFDAISRFCRARTKDYFRFDPFLDLRTDGDAERNAAIRGERLTADEIVAIERADPERFVALERQCRDPEAHQGEHAACNHLFHCGAGRGGGHLTADGKFRLCSMLCHPAFEYDLTLGSLAEAWREFTPRVLDARSNRKEYLEKCRVCSLMNLCMWCPATAYLETGALDQPVQVYCDLAHARAAALGVEVADPGGG